MADSLFVGGCYRSGTTICEKLLHQHPRLSVASQPFPDLYFAAKEAFNDALGLKRRYPLGHLFGEPAYTPQQLDRYLCETKFPESFVDMVADRLRANALGLWTPEVLQRVDDLGAGTFWTLYRQLNAFTAEVFERSDADYVGSKEVLCEEFVPHLLGQGARVVLVLRDPRDMITSLNFRQRDNLTGSHRPVLFSLRLWRKSVAFALEHRSRPDVTVVRYEDLVMDPVAQMREITDMLDVEPHDPGVLTGPIRDQRGEAWSGNSSFVDRATVATGSVGTFTSLMPTDVVEFIESVCWPEMLEFGYDLTTDPHISSIESYRDPFRSVHDAFPADYSNDPVRIRAEIERLRGLGADLDDAALGPMFLFPSVHALLSRHRLDWE